ncbi:bacteriocin [Chryseobacterium paridis]|uniref:Bacteriocin n=1 Tax=Chryseobacterium paridis TaxID=2800328 RepID=A0ABS1FXT1_9FLAO|nr:bacteriocin [Chryseobacterium paridis]MBK1897200.1 bacteriocin [Chryseobacterium paridis]
MKNIKKIKVQELNDKELRKVNGGDQFMHDLGMHVGSLVKSIMNGGTSQTWQRW